ncbi:MAG TPA: DUF2586 family protein [Spirochaetota bacterium]|nr:DUF2586 family protein [Spirochaetota bacterium]HSA14990.1 DUF2586 family protein [Spirochaetota bacterium]
MDSPVTVNLADGRLGQGDEFADGLHVKIGVAEGGSANTVYAIASRRETIARFGAGALVDSLTRHFEEGGKALFAMRPTNSLAGSIGSVTQSGTGPLLTPTGTPTGARSFKVQIVAGGAAETATYRYSNDGGVTWSSIYTTPAQGSSIVLTDGVTISFGTGTFAAGEEYTFATTAPNAAAADFIDAIDAVRAAYNPASCAYTFIHIVGGFARTFWESVKSTLADFETARIFVNFILEYPAYASGDVDAYLQTMLDEYRLFQEKRISVVGGYIRYGDDSVYRSAAILLCANLSRCRTNIHPGWVNAFKSLTGKEIRHWTEIQDFINDLDGANVILAVQYPNWDGIYIKKDHLMGPSTSDYQTIHDLRPADKVRRLAYSKIMPFVNADAEGSDSGVDSLIAEIDLAISQAMEDPAKKEIKGHTTRLTFNASTKAVTGSIDIQPKGTMETITVDVGYTRES